MEICRNDLPLLRKLHKLFSLSNKNKIVIDIIKKHDLLFINLVIFIYFLVYRQPTDMYKLVLLQINTKMSMHSKIHPNTDGLSRLIELKFI